MAEQEMVDTVLERLNHPWELDRLRELLDDRRLLESVLRSDPAVATALATLFDATDLVAMARNAATPTV